MRVLPLMAHYWIVYQTLLAQKGAVCSVSPSPQGPGRIQDWPMWGTKISLIVHSGQLKRAISAQNSQTSAEVLQLPCHSSTAPFPHFWFSHSPTCPCWGDSSIKLLHAKFHCRICVPGNHISDRWWEVLWRSAKLRRRIGSAYLQCDH